MPEAATPRPWRLWRALWRRMERDDRWRVAAAVAITIVASGLTALLPIAIGGLVDHVLDDDRSGPRGAGAPLAAIAGLVVIGHLLQAGRHHLVHRVSTGFECDSRLAAYGHLLRLPLTRYHQGQVGALYGRANRSIEGAARLVRLFAGDLLPSCALALSAVVVAFTRDPLVALAMAGVIPTGFLLVRWQVANQAGVRRCIRDEKERVDAAVTEVLPAVDVVRVNGAVRAVLAPARDACERLRRTEVRHHRAMALFEAAKSINEGLWLLVTLSVALGQATPGTASAGELTACFLLFLGVTAPLRELHRIVDEGSESAQQADDLLDLLAQPEDQVFAGWSESKPASGPRPGHPKLTIRGVRFAYPGATSRVLDGLTLDVAAGESVGLVGSTGCGKSTLLQLLTRLQHGFEGTISIDGVDIRSLHAQQLVEQVGLITQEPKLFRRTIRWNITLGREGISDAEVEDAASRARIHGEIMALSGGYDTVIGERGDTLSGGQRQRLSLARALVRVPPLLLLDEPTSALDGPSQAAVQRAIAALDGTTTVIVAHRLTTLQGMDRIYVLEQGRVAESGTFHDLAARGGRFARMLQEQAVQHGPEEGCGDGGWHTVAARAA